MSSDWSRSVVRISTNKPDGGDGTGFVIHRSENAAYVVTCAHVVHAVGGSEAVLVDGIKAEMVVLGSKEDIDLAVLRVQGLQGKSPLIPCSLGERGRAILIPGFYSPKLPGSQEKEIDYTPLYGELIKKGAAGTKEYALIDVWYLKVTDDDRLELGYSGSPVIDKASGRVVGILSVRYDTPNGPKQGRAISVEALKKIWLTMPPSVFGQDSLGLYLSTKQQEQLKKLESIIAEIDVSETDLERLYYSSVPDDPLALGKWQYPKSGSNKTLLSQLLDKLADASVSGKGARIPPILNFVERLARYTGDLDAKLRRWMEEDALQAWNVRKEDIARLCERLEEEDHTPALESLRQYLLILLETPNKSEDRPSSFTVRAWLCYGQGEMDYEPLFYSNDMYFTNVSLQHEFSLLRLINKLLTDVFAYNKRKRIEGANLMIEFFLPDELLCSDLAVENWEVDDEDDDKIPLGCQYAVVIRSLGRIKALRYRNLWEAKWQRACNLVHSVGGTSIHCISQLTECDGKKIFAKLMKDKYIICLCLMLVPSLIINRREMFGKVLKAGTPIALWPQKLPNEQDKIQDFQKRFRKFILQQKLFDLPDSILQQRLEILGGTDEHCLGTSLTLFWDDPSRVPPNDKLEEPTIRR